MNRVAMVIGLSLFVSTLFGQLQNEMLSTSQRDLVYWNPATIGLDGRPSAGIVYRNVNLGSEYAPLNYAANYQLPIRFQNSAFSATIVKDFIGDQRQNRINLGYRYSIFNHRLDDHRLYAGFSIDFKQDKLLAGNHFARDNDDPLVLTETHNSYGLDFNAGLFYKLYLPSDLAVGDQIISVGASLSNLRAKEVSYSDSIVVSDRPRNLFAFAEWERDMGAYGLDVRYFLSGGKQSINHAILIGVKDVSYMSFSAGYRTSEELLLSWGFDFTDFDDSKIEADITYFYSLSELFAENRNGVQLTVKYLFRPRPWTTSDFR